METIRGKVVCQGIALGNIYVLQKNRPAIRKEKCTDPETEIALVNEAREAVIKDLRSLYEQAVAEVGISNAAIFQMHEMLLQDAEFIISIELWIREGCMNAQWAVAEAGYALEQKFEHFEDEYMKSRGSDIHEVTDRLLKQLMGSDEKDISFNIPFPGIRIYCGFPGSRQRQV
jgi:phosphotransferase system enzyme I (PtsI)